MSDFNPLADLKTPQPFGIKERLITTLLFDTQPKRKAAFLNKLGYEINPKDDNEIKPIGSSNDHYFPIDPGGVFDFSQYTKKGGGSEFGKDLLEGALDLITGTATEATGAGGAILGGSIGTAIAPGAGTIAGGVAGRSAGRVAAFNAIENMKDSIGNLFLEKDVPVDVALRTTQSAIQAIGPEVLSTAAGAVKKAAVKTFSTFSDGVRNLLNIGNGTIGEQAWQALKKNPSAIANTKNLSDASSALDSTISRLTGKTEDGFSINRTVFGDKLNELEPQRKAAANALSKDPNNGAPLDKIIKFFEQKKLDLSDPEKYPIASQQRKDGIRYIQDKINELKKLSAPIVPGAVATGGEDRLSFSQLDSVVKELQSDLYTPKLMTKDWRGAVKSLVDGSPDSPGLNNLLKDKATKAGSPYAQIKDQQSKIFDAYDKVQAYVTPEKAKRFVIGDETLDPRFTSTDTMAKNFGDAIKATDEVLGTSFEEGIRTGQINGQFWKAISDKGASGSGKITTAALGIGGTVGGLIGSKLGPEIGTAAGGLATLGTGALMQPKIGTRVAIGAENMASKIAGFQPNEALGGLAAQLGTQDINSSSVPQKIDDTISPQPSPTPQESFDPLHDFDPLRDMSK